MPEEEAIKCANCSSEMANDAVLHSTTSFGDVCENCYDEIWECQNCTTESISYDNKIIDINGDDVCESCVSSSYHMCEASNEYFNPDTEEYFEYGGTIVHSNSASEYEIDTCCDCGDDVFMNEIYADYWEEEQKCHDCYHNKEHSISNIARHGRDIKVLLDKHYRSSTKLLKDLKNDDESARIQNALYRFKENFYDSYNEFDYNDLYLLKSHIGYGHGYGFWRSNMTVQSEHFKTFATFLRDILTNNLFVVEHKKYGLYHPLREIFKGCLRYYDKKTTKVREGDSITMEQMGNEWLRFSIDFISKDGLLKMLIENKTAEGANLRKLINNIFTRSYKHRLAGHYPDDHNFWNIEQKYKTNSSGIKLPIRLGFDAGMMKDLSNFNSEVGSCQVASNNETYAFGMMDLVTNPHLLLLVYDEKDEKIIGRSVIKFYKKHGEWGNS